MLKIQRKIQAGCDSLYYYMNEKFLFRSDNYDNSFSKLNEEDKKIFYNRDKVRMSEMFIISYT